ncbi:MAG: hypothetical protein ACOVOV_16080 [Dolichospermum sp.]
MNPETIYIAEYMKEFGFHILGRAIYDATFSEMMRPFAHILSVVQAAHGAEMIIKARIAEEHPLLIFKEFPKSNKTDGLLSIKELFEYGKTIMYSDLPEVLWATTGYRMREVERFRSFGNLRNSLVHFAPRNDIDAATETLKFSFEVLDPIVRDFWDESFVGYCEEWDEVIIGEGYLRQQLERLGIEVHPDTKQMIMENDYGK